MGGVGNYFGSLRDRLLGSDRPELIGLFRILFGLLMLIQIGGELFSGSALPRYSDAFIHFKYAFFEWVPSIPEAWVQPYLWFGLATAALVTIGLFYRVAIIGFFLFFLHTFLVDVSYYNNHYYAIVLLSGIMMFANAHRCYSLDRVLFNIDSNGMAWVRILLKFQIVVIYFYGGISKLLNEGWLDNSSTKEMIDGSLSDLGLALADDQILIVATVLTIGGIVFDLFIGFGLLYRKTFVVSAILALCFNLINSVLFTIGVFPFLMIASILLFIPEGFWPRILGNGSSSENQKKSTSHLILRTAVGVYVILQLVLPFRGRFLDVDTMWTGQGHLFSWNMKPGTKTIDCVYRIEDRKSKVAYEIDPHEYLSQPAYLALGKYPFLAPQFAKAVKEKADQWLIAEPMVKATILVSFNRGPYYHVVNPDIDLSDEVYHPYRHNEWLISYPPLQGLK